MQKKPFPSNVRWAALWKHRWVLLNFLNQVAYGTERDADNVVSLYGGSTKFAIDFFRAAVDSIEVEPRRKCT